MVANDIVPGDSDMAECPVEAVEQAEVIKQDISECDAEGGFGTDQFFDDIVGDEVDFLLISGLWIPEENDVKSVGFGGLIQRKVDRCGQWSGGCDAGEVQFRGSGRLVDVITAGDVECIDGGAVAGRFDDEEDGVIVNGQFPASVLIAGDDFPAVGDFDAWQSWFIAVASAVLVGVEVHDAGGLSGCGRGGEHRVVVTAAGSEQQAGKCLAGECLAGRGKSSAEREPHGGILWYWVWEA